MTETPRLKDVVDRMMDSKEFKEGMLDKVCERIGKNHIGA